MRLRDVLPPKGEAERVKTELSAAKKKVDERLKELGPKQKGSRKMAKEKRKKAIKRQFLELKLKRLNRLLKKREKKEEWEQKQRLAREKDKKETTNPPRRHAIWSLKAFCTSDVLHALNAPAAPNHVIIVDRDANAAKNIFMLGLLQQQQAQREDGSTSRPVWFQRPRKAQTTVEEDAIDTV